MAKLAAQTPANLVKVETKGRALVSPLTQAVDDLKVETEDQYQEADSLLAAIRRARRAWEDEIEPVLAPLRQAKSAADALNRKIDGPMEILERTVKDKMREFKLIETRRLEEERRRQDAEAERLRKALDEATAAEQRARTKQMREKLALKREVIENQAIEQAEQAEAATPVPVQAEHSRTRTVKRWRIISMEAVIEGTVNGTVPVTTEAGRPILVIDQAAVTQQFKDDPSVVDSWPGFEVFDDVVIAGR